MNRIPNLTGQCCTKPKYAKEEWGYAGTGMIDAFCGSCGADMGQVPLKDWPWRDHVLSILDSKDLPTDFGGRL